MMRKQSISFAIFFTLVIDKNTSKERHHRKLPDFQRTHWYSLTSPTDTIPSPGEYVDYHLAPDPAPAPSFSSTHAPPSLHTDSVGNVTSQLGQTVYLKCTVIGFRQGVNTVSWTKTTSRRANPIALTFNDKVFVSDSRISVYIDVDTWVLVLLKVCAEDEATYECHVNSDPPRKLAIHLIVQVPIMTVMDGFGRHLTDQYYKAGSSLEVVCELDSVPFFWNSTDISQLLVWKHQENIVHPRPKDGISIQSEYSGSSIFSRLAITQASSVHNGNYSCSVPDFISTPVRIHIVEDENQAFVASGNTNISGKVESSLVNFAKLLIYLISCSNATKLL